MKEKHIKLLKSDITHFINQLPTYNTVSKDEKKHLLIPHLCKVFTGLSRWLPGYPTGPLSNSGIVLLHYAFCSGEPLDCTTGQYKKKLKEQTVQFLRCFQRCVSFTGTNVKISCKFDKIVFEGLKTQPILD